MKLKEFKIDLGGSFPRKSNAVYQHAHDLGYFSEKVFNLEHQVIHLVDGKLFSRFIEGGKNQFITAERFLELTKEDVIEKEPEPELYYRYRIWFKDGNIVDTSSFFYEKEGALLLAGDHMEMYANIAKYERIGEGVAKCAGQK